ncbi:YceI family protein [Phenylobacterium sp.]|uniref:YceI family protein n=1 Tax=Phenylobacterium sp. TaxID=1871053 RepID=UPI0025F7CCD6|nr:YceI family protein [Phenylobacterium sp.]
MPNPFRLLALLAALLMADAARAGTDPSLAAAGVYRLDPTRSSLVAKASLLGGLYRYPLRFGSLSGRLDHNPADLAGSPVWISVDPRSVEAPDKAGTRTALALFDPVRFPTIDFRSRSYHPEAGGRGVLAGDLTLHGVTRPLVLEVTLQDVEPGRLRFSGQGKVRRSEHGMTSGRLVAGDVIDLTFEVEFVRK